MLSEHSYTNYSPSTIRKLYRSRKICSVPKCLNRSYRYTKTSLHRFPQNELRAEWGRILHIKTIPKNAYACSDHFTPNDFACLNKGVGKIRRLKKTAVPSRNIPSLETEMMDLDKQNVVPTKKVEAQSVRRSRAQKKDKSSFISIQTEAVFIKDENIPANAEYETMESIPTDAELRSNQSISTDHKAECRSIETILNEAEYRSNQNISTDNEAEYRHDENRSVNVEAEYRSNENRSVDDEAEDRSHENRLIDDEAEYRSNENISPVVELKIDESTQTEAEFVSNIPRPVTLLHMLYKDEQVQAFTGLESNKAFRRLCDTFERLEPKICPSHCRFETKLEDRILLTLMKLKMNCSFPCLSAFFHTTTTSAATYFYQTLRMMHQFLKHLIPWPSREEVKKNLPKCFDRFPRVRVALDYCEFPVECCGCVECSVRCLSPKKKTHTLKAEFGISPAGLITHVSPVYGGRASDKFILTQSGILDKMEVGDCILTIENTLIRSECEEKGIKLIQPIFSSDEQFILKRPEDVYYIEQAKVHIQQSIQRLKTFAILSDKVSWSMAPYFDEIIGVICGITNLSPPVLPDIKFKI